MSTNEFWDGIYSKFSIRMPDKDNPENQSLVAALNYFGNVENSRILDLGCGKGAASLFFASLGASVVSIDNSRVAIDKLKAFCIEKGIQNIKPMCISAMNILEIGSFDFLFGSMILHHIEPFDEFAFVVRKSLSKNGKAFFSENNASSSVLIWFRQNIVGKFWVPKYGDPDEFPFTPSEVDILRRYFHVKIVYPELLFFRHISTYLLRGHLKKTFRLLDNVFFKIPWFRKYSYHQYLYLSKWSAFYFILGLTLATF